MLIYFGTISSQTELNSNFRLDIFGNLISAGSVGE